MNKLYILTGPAGVGKSTVSQKIAESLEKSVLIEGDIIYNFFVGGRIRPWYNDAPLDLFWSNCFYLINSYLESGYDVVFNYIIKPKYYNIIKEKFSNYSIIFQVLMVDEETIVKRDKERPLDWQMGERALVLLKEFVDAGYDNKYILDTSNLSIDETLKEVVKKTNGM